MTINDKKTEIIQTILKNDTYREDSGLYKNLAHALRALSIPDLSNLNLIINLKITDALIDDEIANSSDSSN